MSKYPMVYQNDIKDCGAASLLMIMKHYGGGISLEKLRDLTNTNKTGTTGINIVKAAEKLNFTSYGVNGSIFDISKENLPCIANVIIDKKYKHFVVIYKIKNKKLILLDPSKGIKEITKKDFLKISTNNYIFLKPNKKIPLIKTNNKIKKIVIENILQNKNNLFLIILFSFIYTLLNIFMSFNFKLIIELGIDYYNKFNIYSLLIIFATVIFVKEYSDYLRNKIINEFNHNFDFSITKNIYKHILSLPYIYFKNKTTGEIINRINDIETIKEVTGKILMSIFIDSILIVFVLITLFSINISLTLIALFIILLNILVINIFKNPMKEYIKKTKEKYSIINSYTTEVITGIETIKGINSNNHYLGNLINKNIDYLNKSKMINNIFFKENFIKDLIELLGIAIIVTIGGLLVIDNKISLANLITFNSLLFYFLEPIRNIMNLDLMVRDAKVSIDRINELFEIEEQTKIGEENKIFTNGDISYKNINYSYNGKDLILENFNLDIKEKEKVLIYGKSGSGKSTIARLLVNYISDYQGEIRINGTNINQYKGDTLRNNICYLSQNEYLFTDSILNNVILGEYDLEKYKNIEEICHLKEIYKNNPLAYDMLLEENGFNISGGERQRIILARALYQNKNIYIFDESFSEIDIELERKIITKIFENNKEKTFIVISHRFNNNNLYSKKIKLDRGLKNG
ncbi:MAG: peptidase domain-containing ABC transporter [Bacilli bacterium]|nr:peptidase domain-containing ABC transporter [Bacilli bacterium]